MGKDLSNIQRIAFICNGDSCLKKGAEDTTTHIRAAIRTHAAELRLHTIRTRCTSQCEHGPVVFVYPEGTWYGPVTPALAEPLVTRHLLAGEPIAESIFYQD